MTLIDPATVRTVGVIGTGTIGASWSAAFLAAGYQVRANDPAPDAEAKLFEFVQQAWPALEKLGAPALPIDRLSFHATPEEAVSGADIVQENAPERVELKQELLARIDRALPPDRVIASSTSGITATTLQVRMAHPRRLVIGHPFNPPHMMPLVEVVGGAATAPETVDWAMTFYRHCAKHPIRIAREKPGHIANRLQAALWREVVSLVADGVASIEDVDAAVAYGPGLRWAIFGPSTIFHLAGGEGGLAHFLDHLAQPMQSWWNSLGNPDLTDPLLRRKLVEAMDKAMANRSIEDLAAERDKSLLGILEVLEAVRGPNAGGSE